MGRVNVKPLPRGLPVPAGLAVGFMLRERREALGWSLAELEKCCGVTRQMIRFIEKNQRSPTLDIVLRICYALDVQAGPLVTAAEQQVLLWPACARGCNYSCIADGQPSCWNPARGCSRSGR